MALPGNFPIFPPVAPVQSGIIIGLAPTDATFKMEIQRAPDSSGVPGTPVSIDEIPPSPLGSGVHYTDILPHTGALYYYRFRHIRTGWTAGSWGPYSRAATAKFLDGRDLPPAAPVYSDPIPPNAPGTVSDETIGSDGIIILGPDGREEYTFNGDIERGLSYWVAGNSTSLPATTDSILANDPVFGLSLEMATQYQGIASLKVNTSGTASPQISQVVRGTNDTGEAQSLVARVEPSFLFRCIIAAKAATVAGSPSMMIRAHCFDGNGTYLSDSSLMPQTTITTSWVLYDSITASALPANTKYISITITGVYPGAAATYYFDNLHVWRLKTAADLGGTIAPVTIDGWYQDNVAASQTDVELTRATGRWRAVQAGSVTGVVATMTEARTAGTLTVTVFKNTGLAGAAGSTIGLTAVIDGTNTSRKATTQAKDTDAFAAGDELYIVVTTDGSWTPTTSDLRAALEVEV